MLISELGRSIQADRQREIEERLRQRGLLEDAAHQAEEAVDGAVRSGFYRDGSKARPVGVRPSGMPAHGRPR
jgi:hypothetical protein